MEIISCVQYRLNRTNISSSLQKQWLYKESYFEELKISTKINCLFLIRSRTREYSTSSPLCWICIDVKVLKILHSVLCGNENSIPLFQFIAFKGTQLWEMQPALDVHGVLFLVCFFFLLEMCMIVSQATLPAMSLLWSLLAQYNTIHFPWMEALIVVSSESVWYCFRF